MLLWGEIAQRRGFLRVQIADGDAAEKRNDCVAVAVKVNGRRSVRVGFFIGNIDLRIDAEWQDFIRRVGIVAVVVNVGVALSIYGFSSTRLAFMAFTGRAVLTAESVFDAGMSEDCFAPQAANVRHNTPASIRVGTEHCNFFLFIDILHFCAYCPGLVRCPFIQSRH